MANWQEEIARVIETVPYETVVFRAWGADHAVRVYAFPQIVDALVSAEMVLDIYNRVAGLTHRQVYDFTMYGILQCLDVADLWLHEYSRTDMYDWDRGADMVSEYDGYTDAVKFGYTGVVLHDLS